MSLVEIGFIKQKKNPNLVLSCVIKGNFNIIGVVVFDEKNDLVRIYDEIFVKLKPEGTLRYIITEYEKKNVCDVLRDINFKYKYYDDKICEFSADKSDKSFLKNLFS